MMSMMIKIMRKAHSSFSLLSILEVSSLIRWSKMAFARAFQSFKISFRRKSFKWVFTWKDSGSAQRWPSISWKKDLQLTVKCQHQDWCRLKILRSKRSLTSATESASLSVQPAILKGRQQPTRGDVFTFAHLLWFLYLSELVKVTLIFSSVRSSSVHHGLIEVQRSAAQGHFLRLFKFGAILPIFIHNLLSLSISIQNRTRQYFCMNYIDNACIYKFLSDSTRFFRFL